MDIPSPVPFHLDPVERPANEVAAFLLGSPVLFGNPAIVTEIVSQVTIQNIGLGILAWRARPQQDWITIDKQGGVALGPDVACSPNSPCQRHAVLTVSVDLALMPADVAMGWVDIVSLTTGQLWQVGVRPAGITPAPTSTPRPTATSTPKFTPSPTPTPLPQIGDANCNRTTDSIDATLILQFGAGLTASLPCQETADVNQDGSVNAVDATLILQFSAGLLPSLPPPQQP